MERIGHIVRAAVAAMPLAANAAAENVTAGDPAALAGVMRDFGFPAEMTTDTQGDPKIVSKAGDEDFSVLFYGCTDGKGCNRILLQAVFLSDTVTLKAIDEWNGYGIYGTSNLGEKDPSLFVLVNMAGGGIAKDNFKDILERWTYALGRFEEDVVKAAGP